MRALRILLLNGCLFVLFSAGAQQTPYLERLVSVKGTMTFSELFRQLSAQTDVVFSYGDFDAGKKVTINQVRKPLRVVLTAAMAESDYNWKLKGKYVILSKKSKSSQGGPQNILNGYIYDAVDSTRLAASSVYLRQNRKSAVTNDYGYFMLDFPKAGEVISISVARENYRDTTVVFLSRPNQTLVIYLQPDTPTKITVGDSSTVVEIGMPDTVSTEPEVEEAPFWSRFGRFRDHFRNINDTLFTKVAFGIVPSFSTNRLLAVNTVNNVSFKLLAGYSKGINGFELGGLANFTGGNVRYVQIAGLTNIVSGSVEGVQVAGICNVDRGGADGVVVGGIANVFGRPTSGFQLAGVYNHTPRHLGGQLSGVANYVAGATYGFQLAGISNYTDTLFGFQVAGLCNKSRKVTGTQIGFLNVAGDVTGSQIGFINLADEVVGVPVGFLSFVRKGYHKLEFAADENAIATVAFRTGVDRFHTFLMAGKQFRGPSSLWTYGYGVGSAFPMGSKLYFAMDVSAQQVQLTGAPQIRLNLLSKAFLGFEYRFANYFGIAFGPTLNVLTSDLTASDNSTLLGAFKLKPLYQIDSGDFTNRMWIGARVSLKFF